MKCDEIGITLRAIEPEDLETLYEIENDEQIWSVGITNVPYSKSMLLDYITHASGDIYADKQVRLMIENEGGKTIGIVDLFDFSPQHQRAELGIVIKREFRGKGYASLVIRKMREYAKKVLHLHQIYAIVPQDNINCIKMLKQSDFQYVTTIKEWLSDGEEYRHAEFFQCFL